MLRKLDFFDSGWNKEGHGLAHQYQGQRIGGHKTVHDCATGLLWQQGGSQEITSHGEAKNWIQELNIKGHTGYHDWRLPTLEEAMSLVELEKKNGDLYIDPHFDKRQRRIWTCDTVAAQSWAWAVNFLSGDCCCGQFVSPNYVRAVR